MPYQQIADGHVIHMGKAILTFIQAPEGDTNARSCMLHVRFGEHGTILLTADIGGRSQRYFLENTDPALLSAQVLKFPHHCLTQAVPEFLTAVNPAFVFVTNSHDGAFYAEAQLTAREIPHLFSYYGTVVMETDGQDWYIFQSFDF